MAKKARFVPEKNDTVKYKREFLKSISWYTDVPKSGRVLLVDAASPDFVIAEVLWDDGVIRRVNTSNLMPANKPDLIV